MSYSVSKIQVMGSQYRSLSYSGREWELLGRLCNVSDRPGIFSKRLGDFVFFSGGSVLWSIGAYCVWCHLECRCAKITYWTLFFMGEACSDVSKKSILSHRHTNLRVRPLHAHMANSNHKRLSIDAYVLFRIHTQTRKYITFTCHALGWNSELSKSIMEVSANFWLPNTYLL